MNATSRRRFAVTFVFAVLGLFALRDVARLGDALPWRTMDDFPDFYCAGWAVSVGANPYTYEPLHGCEHRVNRGTSFRGRLFQSNPGVAVPAPLPPYDFAPLAALSKLPFNVARTTEAVAIVLAVAACVAALAALGVPVELSAAALVLSSAYAELNTGQVVPFALLCLVFAGVALARGKDFLAGILAALTAMEPTLGLPVILAVLVFVPRARWGAAVTLLALAIVSITLVGGPALIQYAIAVIPAQAAAEVHFPFQYSLTYGLAAIGVPPAAARFAGVLSYALAVTAALLFLPRICTALRRRELIVFIPALASVLGGTYLHYEELCFAIPAILILARAARGAARSLLAVALCLLSIPWILVWGSKQLFLASIFLNAVILLRLRIDLRLVFPALLAIASSIYVFELYPPRLPVPPPIPVYPPGALVQDEWTAYAAQRASSSVLWLLVKIPAWAALLAASIAAASIGYWPSTGLPEEG